jgi:hypothetical protein
MLHGVLLRRFYSGTASPLSPQQVTSSCAVTQTQADNSLATGDRSYRLPLPFLLFIDTKSTDFYPNVLRGSRDGWQANSDFISGQWVPISATNLHLLKTAECCSSIKQPVSWDLAPDIQEEMLFLTKENRRPGPHTLRKLCARSPDRWTGIGKGNSCGSCFSFVNRRNTIGTS